MTGRHSTQRAVPPVGVTAGAKAIEPKYQQLADEINEVLARRLDAIGDRPARPRPPRPGPKQTSPRT